MTQGVFTVLDTEVEDSTVRCVNMSGGEVLEHSA